MKIDTSMPQMGGPITETNISSLVDVGKMQKGKGQAKSPPLVARAPAPLRHFHSPLVKALAKKYMISEKDLSQIRGSGEGGRITKQDLLAFVGRKSPRVSKPEGKKISPLQKVQEEKRQIAKPSRLISEIDSRTENTTIMPMDNIRHAIAVHMVRSKHTSPHVYSIQEVDVSNILKWREAHKRAFEGREGFKLSITPFFLEAAVQGLIKYPYVNASVEGKNIILKKSVNLGCAVALENSGLIVPVIKRAEEKSLFSLARALNDLVARARDQKLLPDDVADGTFTVTNDGVFGTLIGTPIINQPQVAILCIGAVTKRPVVVNDMIGIRDMVYLTLSYDHRIVDGALAGQYLSFVRDYLENWEGKFS